MSTIIEINNLSKKYQLGENTVFALKNISLKIEAGDFVAIMGPSGSGKSTLMHLLGLLDTPSTGSYLLDGKEISPEFDSSVCINPYAS
jgi:macrolide transport system ATP-binding/permease protein